MNRQFSDIKNLSETKFKDSPLGKKIDGNFSELPIEMFDKPLGIVIENIKNCPIENGEWTGERGDSTWKPNIEYIPQKMNIDNKEWGEILEEYNIEGIEFKDGEPIFDEISKGEVEIEDFSENRDDNFDKADIEMAEKRGCHPSEVREWRKENKYTWHECRDMQTMQKVISVVHNNISHSGGIAEVKKGE